MRLGLSAERRVWAERLVLNALLALLLAGCAAVTGNKGDDLATLAAAPAAVAFGPDGRLWRAMAGSQRLYVDYSSDLGKSFSPAVAVNGQAQRIRSNSEDRPNIAVDKTGRIWVTYAADAVQPGTAYFSYSEDGGKTFSEPAPVSDQAAGARAFLATLALDGANRPYFFWHDERDGNTNAEHGGSLYYASMDTPSTRPPPAKRVMRTSCEQCRVEVAFDSNGLPVLFGRFVFPVKERDHGLAKITSDGKGWSSSRITNDNWETDTCPKQGPAFAIDAEGHYHVAWFTQGKNRQGLFYARSDDHGKHFTPFMPFGDKQALASYPALASLGSKVALAWQEFDGNRTQIKAMLSRDGGEHWSSAKLMAQSQGAVDHPLLASDGRQIYLSWNSSELGYRLMVLD